MRAGLTRATMKPAGSDEMSSSSGGPSTTLGRCREHLRSTPTNVFRTLAFLPLGSRAAVQRALAQLIREGHLVRIGVGVYARAKRSPLTGNVIPVAPMEVLVPEALALFGVEVRASKAYRDYNEGRTTQVPGQFLINTGKRRITRRLQFKGRGPGYERG